MRIGIYGGSFDPIHVAHLLLAETAAEHLSLDSVRFIPAAQSPLKSHPHVSAKDRCEMVQLAIWGNAKFDLDRRETERSGVSYTVDTLEQYRSEFPDAELFLLMGADSLRDFPRWHLPKRITELAQVAVAYRGAEPAPDFSVLKQYLPEEELAQCSKDLIRMPQLEISSSDLRERIAKGQSIRYRVPAAVSSYIQSNKLYLANQ